MKKPRQRKLQSKSRLKLRPIRETEPAAPRTRPNAGWAKKGEPGRALKHGLYSKVIRRAELPEQAAFKAALAEMEAEKIADLGGAEVISSNQRDLLRLLLEHLAVKTYLADRLLAEGPLTGKGRQRALLSAYLAVADRIVRLAVTLGLQKKPKQIPSLEDFLKDRQPQGEPS